ncbi:hypothetical protein D3C78_1379600 [compost metagenome]
MRRSRSSLSRPSPLSTQVALTLIAFGAAAPFSSETLCEVPSLSKVTTDLVMFTGFAGGAAGVGAAAGASSTSTPYMPQSPAKPEAKPCQTDRAFAWPFRM